MSDLSLEVKEVILKTIPTGMSRDLPDDFKLLGEALDSMAVTNLILAIEEYFGIEFDDDDLTAEVFETVSSLSQLVASKVNATG